MLKKIQKVVFPKENTFFLQIWLIKLTKYKGGIIDLEIPWRGLNPNCMRGNELTPNRDCPKNNLKFEI